MTKIAQENCVTKFSKNFWYELLKFGENEKDRRRNWNIFCTNQLNLFSTPLVSKENQEKIHDKMDLGVVTGDVSNSLEELAKTLHGPIKLPEQTSVNLESFMDLSDLKFGDDISFAGRILIGADFRNTCFQQNANFNDAEFVGLTHFDGAKLQSNKAGLLDGVLFKESTFHNTAYFNSAAFHFRTRFDGAKFLVAAYFKGTKFESEIGRNSKPSGIAVFQKCQFANEADFTDAKFEFGVDFADSEFQDITKFENATFRNVSRFNNAKFKSTTSFRNAEFGMPPKFFETELDEDTDFSQVDWVSAEKSYSRSQRCSDALNSVIADADNAVRAWDRLALIMSQREKLAERHEFFRLKMRAQRQRDGRNLLSLANWLFDVTSDYGWSIGRAFWCWSGHIAIGAVALLLIPLIFPDSVDPNHFQTLWNGILVSFANAHAILGLASEGGYLHDARVNLYSVAGARGYLNAVGTVQTVLGPIFLFLVLLTLRNRFRIG